MERNPYDSETESEEEKEEDDVNVIQDDEEDQIPVKEYTIDEVIQKVVDELWEKHDRPKNEDLTKDETSEFVKSTLKDMGEQEEKFV